MKLLLDQGLPRSAAAHLEASGIDALHVGDVDQTFPSRVLEDLLVVGP